MRNRATRDEQRLQSGGVPAKELSGLQHELTSLARRQGTLEDELLEVMERAEESESTLPTLRAEHDGLAGEIADLEASARRARSPRSTPRSPSAAPSARRSRPSCRPTCSRCTTRRVQHNGGTGGAAELRQRRCEGCRIELSGSELSAVRNAAPDDVMRCDNCRRILVRTAESGL